MQYTTLGKTGLRVSVAGLGTGGFSRLGLRSGKTEDEAARLIHDAVGLGINFIDTAPSYGTEGAVGKALKSIPRDKVVVATKASVQRNGAWTPPESVATSLDNSLRLMGTDYVDVLNLHGVLASQYDHARKLGDVLLEQKAKGKIRHIGITENPIEDYDHDAMKRVLRDPIWEVVMVGFSMMYQNARQAGVSDHAREGHRHALDVRGAQHLCRSAAHRAGDARARRQGPGREVAGRDVDPLGFLIHAGGAANVTEAAYRYVRYEPGVDVVLFGTGDAGHLRTNVASLLKPPLPDVDRKKIADLFGHLTGVGLELGSSAG